MHLKQFVVSTYSMHSRLHLQTHHLHSHSQIFSNWNVTGLNFEGETNIKLLITRRLHFPNAVGTDNFHLLVLHLLLVSQGIYTHCFSTGFLKWLTTPRNSSSQPRKSLSIDTCCILGNAFKNDATCLVSSFQFFNFSTLPASLNVQPCN